MRIVQINGGAKGSTGKIMMGIAEVARAVSYTHLDVYKRQKKYKAAVDAR